jgi:hypothetical protein
MVEGLIVHFLPERSKKIIDKPSLLLDVGFGYVSRAICSRAEYAADDRTKC